MTNASTFEIAGSDALATSITNTTGTVQVDAGDTLTLSGASISGGTISIAANGELVGTGESAIDNATIDNSPARSSPAARSLWMATRLMAAFSKAPEGAAAKTLSISAPLTC